MADGSANASVMRRKAGAGRPAPEIPRFDLPRALKLAFAQAAEEEMGLVATASPPTRERTTIAKVLEGRPESTLYLLLEGPDERFGLAVLDAASLAALIEIQTTGRVVPGPPPERVPTRTDSLLVESFVNRLLGLFHELAAEGELEAAPALAGFRQLYRLADARAVEMTLPDIPYDLFSLEAEYGDGARQGQVLLLMPPAAAGGERTLSGAAWQERFVDIVREAPAEVEAILARRQMLLREVAALRPGALIRLPLEVIGSVVLEDLNGVAVATGRLGQAEGFRAIRLTVPDAQEEADTQEAAFGLPEIGAEGAQPGGLPDPAAEPASGAAAGGLADLPGMPPDLPDLSDLSAQAGPGDGAGVQDLPDPAEPAGPDTPGQAGTDLPPLDDGGTPGELPDLGTMGESAPGGLPDLGELPDLSSL